MRPCSRGGGLKILCMELTAKDVARNLVQVYAKRGDDVDQFRGGYLGSCSNGNWASVGGYMDGKQYPNTKILVTKLGGEECGEIFSLYEIWEDVLRGEVQSSLF